MNPEKYNGILDFIEANIAQVQENKKYLTGIRMGVKLCISNDPEIDVKTANALFQEWGL